MAVARVCSVGPPAMSLPTLPSRATLHRWVTDRIAIDARALATFRIALGCIVLLDLALRARSLVAFYTDDGVVGRAVLADLYPVLSSLSFHTLSGDAWWQIVLFGVAAVAAVAMIVGYRTRIATAVTLLLLVSLHARNPTVLNSGDVLLRRVVFWGALLPLGRRWSLDAVRSAGSQSEGSRRSIANLASFGLLLQVALVYAVNAQSKLGSEQWFGGHAVESVLSLDGYAVGVAPLLTGFPELLTGLTWAWLVLLVSSWLLLATAGRLRDALAAAFFGAHLGMLLTIDLGIFPLVSMAGLLPFLSSAVWDRLDRIREHASVPGVGLRQRFAPRDRTGETTAAGSGRSRLTRYARPTLHATCIVLLLVSNVVALGVVPVPDDTPDELTDSSWNMFARPPTTDVWTVVDGRLASGERVDALNTVLGRADRPPDGDRYPDARWRKHRSRYPNRPPLRPALAAYVCRQWPGGDSLETVAIERVYERDGGRAPRHRTLGRYRCVAGGVTPVAGGER